MRRVIWEDRNGYTRASLVRDGDPDEDAEYGVPIEPPDLDKIEWEEVKRDLYNNLVRQGIFTYEDMRNAQNAIRRAVILALHKKVVDLYKRGGNTNE
jgi:hypothetical protein